jgi:hypothetical protein
LEVPAELLLPYKRKKKLDAGRFKFPARSPSRRIVLSKQNVEFHCGISG